MIDLSDEVNLILNQPEDIADPEFMDKYWIDTIWPPIVLRPALSPPAASGWPIAKQMGYLAEWRARARSRRLLQRLDDRMLRDVGLTRADVARECAKNFWQR